MAQFRSIQYLRGLAALLVVFFHASPREVGLAGEAGVDVFFVISGFVMWIATAGRTISSATFLYQRIVRVVPLYWLFTLVLAAAAFVAPQAFPRLVLTGERLLQSLAFIPHVEPHTGLILPLLVQGWTLNYEMFFYVLMALALFLPRAWRFAAVVGVIVALALTGTVAGRPGPLASVYLDPLLIEFAIGLAIGALATHGRLPGPRTGFALATAGAAVLFSTFVWAESAEHYRLLAWGLAGGALVAGVVAVEQGHGMPDWKLASLIGDSSYSLYLTHTFVISVVYKIIDKVFADPSLKSSLPTVLIVIVSSSVVGIVVYRAIEQPLLRVLRMPGKSRLPQTQAAR